MPALLTRMSRRWKVRSMRSASASTESRSVTSHSITELLSELLSELFSELFPELFPEFCPPLVWMAAAVCSRAARERPQRTVCAPSSARVTAMAWPMTRPAPVMTATWPASGGCDAVFVKMGSSREHDYSILHRRYFAFAEWVERNPYWAALARI